MENTDLWKTVQPLLELYQRQYQDNDNSTVAQQRQQQQEQQERLVQEIVALLMPQPPNDDDFSTETRMVQVQQLLRHILDCAVAAIAAAPGGKANHNTSSDASTTAAKALISLVAHVTCRLLYHPPARVVVVTVVDSVWQRWLQFTGCTSDKVRAVTVESLGCWIQAVTQQMAILLEQQQDQDYVDDDDDDSEESSYSQQLITWLDQLQQAVIAALTDKTVAVRSAALTAARAFGATDPDVQQGWQWLAQHDPSAANRAQAVASLPRNLSTLTALVCRVRDTHVRVRVAALQRLGGCGSDDAEDEEDVADRKKNLQLLQSHHWASIVRAADTDRCPATRQALRRLVGVWIRACQFEPLKVLQWIRVEHHPVEAAQVLNLLLQLYCDEGNGRSEADNHDQRQHDELRLQLRQGLEEAVNFTLLDLLPAVPVTSSQEQPQQDNAGTTNNKSCDYPVERLFCVRQVLSSSATTTSFLTQNEKEQLFHKLVPDIPTLVQVLEGLVTQLVEMLVNDNSDQQQADNEDDDDQEKYQDHIDSLLGLCTQLLQLATLPPTESLEEGSRRVLRDAMKRMLETLVTPDALLEPCVQALQRVVVGANADVNAPAQHHHHQQPTWSSSSWDPVVEIVTHLSRQEETQHEELRDNFQLRKLSILSIVLESWTPPPGHHLDGLAAIIVPLAHSAVLHHANNNNNNSRSSQDDDDNDTEHKGNDHPNPLVSEAAIICLGKLGLYQDQGIVRDEYLPLMLQVALDESQEQRMEVRAQAMLAICDWSLLFANAVPAEFRNLVSRFLVTTEPKQSGGGSTKNNNTVITGTVCVVAEIAAKLLLAGKVCDSDWLAALVAIFFAGAAALDGSDADEHNNSNEDDDPTEVGSPVRLQQLLSVFFPTATARWKTVRDALAGCVGSLLPWACRDKKLNKALPKMLDFIVSTVEQGRQVASTAAQQRQQQQAPTRTEDDPDNGVVVEKESSPELIVAVQVATYLTESASDLNTTTLRVLCKVIGTLQLDLDRELYEHLSLMKELLEELGNIIDDATSLRSLAVASEQLVDVEMEEEVRDDEEEEEEDEVEALLHSVSSGTLAKENQGIDGSDDDDDDDNDDDDDDFRAPKGKSISSSTTTRSTRRSTRRRLRPSN